MPSTVQPLKWEDDQKVNQIPEKNVYRESKRIHVCVFCDKLQRGDRLIKHMTKKHPVEKRVLQEAGIFDLDYFKELALASIHLSCKDCFNHCLCSMSENVLDCLKKSGDHVNLTHEDLKFQMLTLHQLLHNQRYVKRRDHSNHAVPSVSYSIFGEDFRPQRKSRILRSN